MRLPRPCVSSARPAQGAANSLRSVSAGSGARAVQRRAVPRGARANRESLWTDTTEGLEAVVADVVMRDARVQARLHAGEERAPRRAPRRP